MYNYLPVETMYEYSKYASVNGVNLSLMAMSIVASIQACHVIP